MFVQDEMNWLKSAMIKILMKRYSVSNYLHGLCALSLNVCVILSCFHVIPHYLLLVWGTLSLIASYNYFAAGYGKSY